MSYFDGNDPEMLEQRSIDDREIDVALAGDNRRPDADALTAFVTGVRTAVTGLPAPSPAMAAVLAAGFSTDNGDLPATAASNVDGPAEQASGLPKWRTITMKIRGFIAGLGIAGKIALGVSVAAAAAAGAGAAGVLPAPNHEHAHHHVTGVVVTTSTTTTTIASPAPTEGTGPVTHHADPPAATTTTLAKTEPPPDTVSNTEAPPPPAEPTPTTTPTHDEPHPTTPPTEPPKTEPTTTTSPAGTESIHLSCSVTGPAQVTCTWTPAGDSVVKYALWRWKTDGNGSDYGPVYESPNGLSFVDNSVTPGTPYTYRVFTTRDGGSAGDFSNRAYISCCS